MDMVEVIITVVAARDKSTNGETHLLWEKASGSFQRDSVLGSCPWSVWALLAVILKGENEMQDA